MNYRVLFALVLNTVAATCFAEGAEWRRYQVPSTGANVDIPVSIFTEDAGSPEGGTGRRFFTQDHRADLTIQSVPNPGNDSPAEFLQKRLPPHGIQYKRVGDFRVSPWVERRNPPVRFMNACSLQTVRCVRHNDSAVLAIGLSHFLYAGTRAHGINFRTIMVIAVKSSPPNSSATMMASGGRRSN